MDLRRASGLKVPETSLPTDSHAKEILFFEILHNNEASPIMLNITSHNRRESRLIANAKITSNDKLNTRKKGYRNGTVKVDRGAEL